MAYLLVLIALLAAGAGAQKVGAFAQTNYGVFTGAPQAFCTKIVLLVFIAQLAWASAQKCTTAIPTTTSSAHNYGVFSSGTTEFCTNVLPTQYTDSALQLSRHQAAPGYRLTLTVTAWNTEAGYDYGVVYKAAAGTAVTTGASCALTGGTRLGKFDGAPLPPPRNESDFGAQIGLCFYSDSSIVNSGIIYTITTTACPAGFYCPAANAIPCPAGTSSSSIGATSSSTCITCSTWYSAAGASSCSYSMWDCPAGTYAQSATSGIGNSCSACPAVRSKCAAALFSSRPSLPSTLFRTICAGHFQYGEGGWLIILHQLRGGA
jgi:hypothetical protein